MIGNVGCEIGVAAVRLHQRPVDVVAKVGGAEQCLLAVLLVLDRAALGRRQTALVDLLLGAQTQSMVSATGHPVLDQRPLGEEDVVLDVERGEVAA